MFAPNHLAAYDLRDHFYSHGEIASVRMHEDKGAFVEYTTGEAADLAIITMNKKFINGRKILVNWARQPKRGNPSIIGPSASGARPLGLAVGINYENGFIALN